MTFSDGLSINLTDDGIIPFEEIPDENVDTTLEPVEPAETGNRDIWEVLSELHRNSGHKPSGPER